MDVVTYNKTKNYTLQDFEQCTLRQLISIVRQHMKFAVKNLNKKTKTDIASEMYTFHINNKIQVIGEHKEEEKEENIKETNQEEKCIKLEQFKYFNIPIYGTHEEPLFRATDIGKVLELSNIHMSINEFDKKDEIRTMKITDSIGRKQKVNMLTKNGVCKLLCKSRKTGAIDISKQLGINVYNHKYECKETESITMILKTFKGEKMEQQYRIGTYRIDLYFIEYNLCIECDEYNHMDRDMVYETERYNYISTMLKCKWIRYNPDDKNFNIFSILNEIFIIIKNNIQH